MCMTSVQMVLDSDHCPYQAVLHLCAKKRITIPQYAKLAFSNKGQEATVLALV